MGIMYQPANARPALVVDYLPDPARPIRGLMADIGARLTGQRGGIIGPGPGTPETAFTGYAPAAPSSIVYDTVGLSGGGTPYPDRGNNTLSSAVSGGPTTSLTMAMFAERLRRQGVDL